MDKQTINFLTQLKNASIINHELIITNTNKLIFKILQKMYEEGFILSYNIKNKKGFDNLTSNAEIKVRQYWGKSVFRDLKIMSKPSKETQLSYHNICRITTKKTLLILSTHEGLLNLDECKKRKLGGVLLFKC